MKEELRMAWRNLWRNKRRTLVTSSSVFFAVFFSVIMRSYQLGSYDQIINNFIESFSGYLQVQHADYQNNPLIDNSFDYNDSVAAAIMKLKDVVSVTPHLESFSLASSGAQTKGVAIVAIDPELERKFTDPAGKLVRYRFTPGALEKMKESGLLSEKVLSAVTANIGRAYSSTARMELELGLSQSENEIYIPEILKFSGESNEYLKNDDDGILVSDRLAGYLKVSKGDTVVLMGQGYHGASAAGIFPVRGIIKIPASELDSRLVIMTIPAAQEFFGAEGKITSLAVNLTSKSGKIIRKVRNEIKSLFPDSNTSVKTWYELNPVLYQQIQGDSQSGAAMLGLLYFIIFFGIFGTVLMMVAERKREFGVLVAIGTQKKKLKRIVAFEMIMLGITGLLAGLIASAPLVIYFYYHPIVLKGDLARLMEDYGWDPVMPAAWFGPYFYWQAVVVALMVLIASMYPMRQIGKLKEIEALRS